MASWTILCSCALLLSTWATLSIEAARFDYNPSSEFGPDHWGNNPNWTLCGNGRSQSPIDIRIASAPIATSLGRLNIQYREGSAGVLINTGHGVEVSLESEVEAGRLMIGAELYTLAQFHFHAPSEHLIDNVSFPLEMHMVHRSATGKIAVVAILFSLGTPSQFLNQFGFHLHEVAEEDAQSNIAHVNMNSLDAGHSYARYQGSLTTPPCSENVTWTVRLSTRNTISETQLNVLTKIFGGSNARPIQPLNGRVVQRFPTSFAKWRK